MDGHADNFEDQFRRMVVGNGANSTSVTDASPQHYPTVRLPPSNFYPAPQQVNAGFPANPQNGYLHSPPAQLGPQTHSQPPHASSASQPFQNRHHPQGSYANQSQAPRSYQQNRGGFYGPKAPRMNDGTPGQRSRHQQQVALDPNAFQRSGYGPPRGRGGAHQLFNPHQVRPPHMTSFNDQQQRKINYLQATAATEVGNVQMSQAERIEKDSFQKALQQVCNDVCDADPDRLPHVSLECFGSFKSGFATAGSDMDLVIVVKDQSSTSSSLSLLEDDLPRALEKKLLQLGCGARLLTRTRVPIIKVCQQPDSSLLSKLRAEREKWDLLPNELKYPHLHQELDDDAGAGAGAGADLGSFDLPLAPQNDDGVHSLAPKEASTQETGTLPVHQNGDAEAWPERPVNSVQQSEGPQEPMSAANGENTKTELPRPKREERPWTRERKAGPLDFPKSGVGIQSDINFFNPLGLHNTHLLYCYSLCDGRVQPMVLFVKAWAKRRKINSSYSGTLSSYGYVLMVLHYLVNIASPPVLPNLQDQKPHPGQNMPPDNGVEVDGWNVQFWHDDEAILTAKQRGQITANREPLGSLLAGFFQYYSSQGGHPQFVWTQQTLSLRSQGGILSKEEKGWTKAVTEEGEGKKIQHRYLFCIEDPFELNHNVARTVTHNGIVAIRDEFRRARRILLAVGRGEMPIDGQLFDELVEPEEIATIAHETKTNGWQPDLNTPRDAHTPRAQNQTQHKIAPSHDRGGPRAPAKRPAQTSTTPKSSALNVKDDDAFPSLGSGSTKSSSKKRSSHKRTPSQGEWSEISGDQAKAVLDEVKRKRDEAQAESTAMGAAEAVLGDEW